MAALTLRTTLGSVLSITQMDNNLTSLNGNSAALTTISSITTLTGGTGVSSPNNLGQQIEITAAVAVTMPLANTAINGAVIQFTSTITGASVVAQGSDTFYVGNGTVTSFTLNVGDTLELVSNGSNQWLAASGSATLPYSAQATTLVNGIQTIAVGAGGTYTLTTPQALAQIMKFTGTLTSNINVIVPANGKTFTVWNATTGAFTLTVKTSSGSGILVTQGMTQELICEGTNIIIASNDLVGAGIASITSVQTAVNGLQSISVAGSANVTLTTAQAAEMIIVLTGAITANITVAVPAVTKFFTVLNSTTGAFTVTVIATGGTGVAVSQGYSQILYCNGTNVVLAGSDLASIVPPVAAGCTMTSVDGKHWTSALTGAFTGNNQLTYANRGNLRTTEGPASSTTTVQSLGVFTWALGSTEIDDDETAFASVTGVWTLTSTDPDYVWATTNNEIQQVYLKSSFNQTVTSLSSLANVIYNIEVLGANVGDSVIVSQPNIINTISPFINAFVSSHNNVTVNFVSQNGVATNLNTGMWNVLVISTN
jgi:hypothetical protein